MKFLGRNVEIEIDGIDLKDWPDFCDAYISEAWYVDTGSDLTDTEIEMLAECYAVKMNELVHEEVVNRMSA